jgi:hypothetical protein
MAERAMKACEGKVQLHLLPPAALHDIARVREFGARKYADFDWTKSRDWTDYYNAVQRHTHAWLTGEDCDPESGLSHLAHAACNLIFLLEFARSGAGNDNRPKGLLINPYNEEKN